MQKFVGAQTLFWQICPKNTMFVGVQTNYSWISNHLWFLKNNENVEKKFEERQTIIYL